MELVKMQRYESYKDSGVDWIGEIPNSWEIKKLKHVFFEKKHRKNMTLNSGAISFGKVVEKDDEKITLSTKASYQEVLNGEFLINPLNLNYDLISLRIALSKIDVVVSAGYIVLKEKVPINKDYFKFLLHRYDVAFMKLLGSGVRQTISFNHIANSLLAFPSIAEQTAIANFLDQKTAQIDEAITIKEQQIELLKERKQIIIQKTVTQGLNSNVPMRDSGVEWIGKVPEHWEIKKLKFFCKFSGGGTPSKDNLKFWIGGDVPWVSPKDMKSDRISQTQDYITQLAVKKSATNYVKPGSLLLVVRSGILQRTIPVAINDITVTLNQDMKALTLDSTMLSEYLFAFIQGNTNALLAAWTKEGATVESIEHGFIANGKIPIPPIDEQLKIIKKVSELSLTNETTLNLLLHQIEKLKEYKTTLINSAVTGKIRV